MKNIKQIKAVEIHYCPKCGQSLEQIGSLLNEYWSSNENVYFCWCSKCSWRGEIKQLEFVVISEPVYE